MGLLVHTPEAIYDDVKVAHVINLKLVFMD